MLFIDGGLGLLVFGLWIFCIIDVITTDESLCRNLPKGVWVLIVLLLVDIGAVLWLVAGRTWSAKAGTSRLPYKGNRGDQASRFPEYDRPGRFAATNPDDDEAFLAQLRHRAEDQRRSYQRRRQAELEAEQQRLRERPDDYA
jgi:hypothetical protein